MDVSDLLYGAYERKLVAQLPPERLPRHVAVMLDGNRRWARENGAPTADGHRAGADNIIPFLGWSEEVGIEIVTLWMLSTDNLKRDPEELAPLLRIIADVVGEVAGMRRWRVNPVGALDLLPEATRAELRSAAERTADVEGMVVNVAVSYGGRQEIADAVRALLRQAAAQGRTLQDVIDTIDTEAIAEHLYTRGSPTPTSSSAPPVRSASGGSSSGRAPTASSTSARPTGPTSGAWTSSVPCGRSPTGNAGSGPDPRLAEPVQQTSSRA